MLQGAATEPLYYSTSVRLWVHSRKFTIATSSTPETDGPMSSATAEWITCSRAQKMLTLWFWTRKCTPTPVDRYQHTCHRLTAHRTLCSTGISYSQGDCLGMYSLLYPWGQFDLRGTVISYNQGYCLGTGH